MTVAARKTWPLKSSSSLNNAEESFLYLIVAKLLETNILLNIMDPAELGGIIVLRLPPFNGHIERTNTLVHPHEDHIGGLPAVMSAFQVKEIIDSGVAATSDTYKQYYMILPWPSIAPG